MKNTTRIARLILAGTTAVLLSQGAMAQTYAKDGLAALYANLVTGLEAIKVSTAELPLLTGEQLGQIAAILDGSDTDAAKKTAAETVFRDSLHPATVSMGSAEASPMEEQLKAQLASVGLEYPAKGLTFAQVQQLMDIFQATNANDKIDAEAVLSNIENHQEETMLNPGAIQLQEQLTADMTRVGIVLPAGKVLTFDEVIRLTSVFDRKTNDSDKAIAAKAILGMD